MLPIFNFLSVLIFLVLTSDHCRSSSTAREVSVKLCGKVYSECVRSSLLLVSEMGQREENEMVFK